MKSSGERGVPRGPPLVARTSEVCNPVIFQAWVHPKSGVLKLASTPFYGFDPFDREFETPPVYRGRAGGPHTAAPNRDGAKDLRRNMNGECFMNAPTMVKRERERKPEQTCPPLPCFVRENISQQQRDAKGSDKSKKGPTIDVSRHK